MRLVKHAAHVSKSWFLQNFLRSLPSTFSSNLFLIPIVWTKIHVSFALSLPALAYALPPPILLLSITQAIDTVCPLHFVSVLPWRELTLDCSVRSATHFHLLSCFCVIVAGVRCLLPRFRSFYFFYFLLLLVVPFLLVLLFFCLFFCNLIIFLLPPFLTPAPLVLLLFPSSAGFLRRPRNFIEGRKTRGIVLAGA